jgi:hypothetical protein
MDKNRVSPTKETIRYCIHQLCYRERKKNKARAIGSYDEADLVIGVDYGRPQRPEALEVAQLDGGLLIDADTVADDAQRSVLEGSGTRHQLRLREISDSRRRNEEREKEREKIYFVWMYVV